MASIPFSNAPIFFLDEETGVTYTLAQPTDEIEVALQKMYLRFNPDIKKRLAEFEADEMLFRKWINGHVDIIVKGWNSATALPEITATPSAQMRGALKEKILQYWREQTTFTKEDLVK
jgi:hypothetical protein